MLLTTSVMSGVSGFTCFLLHRLPTLSGPSLSESSSISTLSKKRSRQKPESPLHIGQAAASWSSRSYPRGILQTVPKSSAISHSGLIRASASVSVSRIDLFLGNSDLSLEKWVVLVPARYSLVFHYFQSLTSYVQSSLTLALLRCIYTEGTVHYDGIPTNTVNLDALRSNITIIPQMVRLQFFNRAFALTLPTARTAIGNVATQLGPLRPIRRHQSKQLLACRGPLLSPRGDGRRQAHA